VVLVVSPGVMRGVPTAGHAPRPHDPGAQSDRLAWLGARPAQRRSGARIAPSKGVRSPIAHRGQSGSGRPAPLLPANPRAESRCGDRGVADIGAHPLHHFRKDKLSGKRRMQPLTGVKVVEHCRALRGLRGDECAI